MLRERSDEIRRELEPLGAIARDARQQVGDEHAEIAAPCRADGRDLVLLERTAEEDVDVQRVPVGRVVDVMPEVRTEGDTTIVPVVEETVVVRKRFLGREEMRITKRRSERKRRIRVPVRREQVEIEHELAREELQRRQR